MKTSLCDLLGIKIPIILAPMGNAVGPRLTAAVCNAGGLGTIPLWRADIETLRRQIHEVKSLTEKPFAVNLNLDFPQEERLEACLQERVPVISFFWGDPGGLVSRAKASGAIVMQTVGSAEEAQAAVRYGVDIVVAQGWEAGPVHISSFRLNSPGRLLGAPTSSAISILPVVMEMGRTNRSSSVLSLMSRFSAAKPTSASKSAKPTGRASVCAVGA